MEQQKITLRIARVSAGLRARETAQKLGIHINTLYRWESGANIPRADTLRRLCRLYQIDETNILLPGENRREE